ncbi:retrotransposon protein, putative, ty1-copia subclass [Tanacetum coccineum]
MFEKPPAIEIYDLVDALHSCRQTLGKPVSEHVLEMKGLMDQLHTLGKPYDNDMAVNLINRSLNKDFGDFVRNFNMHCVGKTVTELHALLIDFEKGLKDKAPTPQVFTIQKGRDNKPKLSETRRKENPNKDQACHHCHVAGHWKRNCPLYIEELRANKKKSEPGAAVSGFKEEGKLSLGIHICKVAMEHKQLLKPIGILAILQDSHAKLHREVQNLTSPYTPQQNGVSERRNRTLLDMVRSMFNLTTLPLSFWDYALESVVRILNMVPTKKRSVKCIFVGYPKETMGYYFYFPPENKVIVARYGDFLERDLISQEFSGRDYDLEGSYGYSLKDYNVHLRSVSNMEVEEDVVGDLGEPLIIKLPLDPPPNAKIVRSKWIFKKKTDMDGKVHTYKARLVAKGCTQTYGVDYEETFSPVADIRAIRILIAIAAYYDYEIWQMDVKTAFLNGRLDEDIYMEQPEGYVNPKYPNRVCKLQRSIYGLKQASRQWNKRFDEEIKRFGFTQNRDEPCVYRKASGSNVVFLILYVDDILIMGNNIPRLKEVKDYLGKCFSMKDLGEAAYILGIKIYRDRSLRLIGLNQSAYIDKILKKFSMQNSKKGFIPMEVKHDLSNEMCASSDEEKAYMKKVPYASAVGSIMYAVRCTRPDVAFAQILVSRYHRIQESPWVADNIF